ncbi:hypothetical protein CDD83_10706 [Cordyceps sp. RAO-2017]|nr:hypothetical protein CDD83_10706 [Cordyceps sp. RAO-2017]
MQDGLQRPSFHRHLAVDEKIPFFYLETAPATRRLGPRRHDSEPPCLQPPPAAGRRREVQGQAGRTVPGAERQTGSDEPRDDMDGAMCTRTEHIGSRVSQTAVPSLSSPPVPARPSFDLPASLQPPARPRVLALDGPAARHDGRRRQRGAAARTGAPDGVWFFFPITEMPARWAGTALETTGSRESEGDSVARPSVSALVLGLLIRVRLPRSVSPACMHVSTLCVIVAAQPTSPGAGDGPDEPDPSQDRSKARQPISRTPSSMATGEELTVAEDMAGLPRVPSASVRDTTPSADVTRVVDGSKKVAYTTYVYAPIIHARPKNGSSPADAPVTPARQAPILPQSTNSSRCSAPCATADAKQHHHMAARRAVERVRPPLTTRAPARGRVRFRPGSPPPAACSLAPGEETEGEKGKIKLEARKEETAAGRQDRDGDGRRAGAGTWWRTGA